MPGKQNLSILVAVAENNVIGKDNKLIWHLPADLKLFKTLTLGHHIIMGRKTFESIGKPLPGRTSVIITRQSSYKADGCIVVNSLQEALDSVPATDEEPFIIGGADIFEQSLPFVKTVYLTKIHHTFEGDTFFPELRDSEWMPVEKTDFLPDEKNPYNYSFLKFVRK